ncbi:MAG: hypothetical protein IBJ11_07030 [Phycisphaerales bacterium]|nr:hypothetical protein [Phycisphaerales bacterium]
MTTRPALFRRSAAALLVLAPAPWAAGGPPIYSNAGPNVAEPGLATGAVSQSGVAAPAGSLWSEVARAAAASECNVLAGLACHPSGGTGGYRLAESFTVPANFTWRIDSVRLFAYDPGAAASASPFASVNLRIWSGRPGDAGSSVVFGDTATNRLIGATNTNILRIFNSAIAPAPPAPDGSKIVWQVEASAGATVLNPGTYWLDWQIAPVGAADDAFTPGVTVPGSRTLAGWGSRQLKPSVNGGSGGWADVIDPGKPAQAADVALNLPFILMGAITPVCPADVDGNRSVGANDLSLLLVGFGLSPGQSGYDPRADLDNNGSIGANDLSLLLVAFGTSCP